jgi:small-conductance mechanosensitive channel
MVAISEQYLAQLVTAALFILSGFLIGLLAEKVLFKKLVKLTEQTAWAGDDIIVASLQGIFTPFATTVGIYAALFVLPLSKNISQAGSTLLVASMIMLITASISKITVGFVQLYSKELSHILPSSSIFVNITRITVLGCGSLIALQTLGISITPLLTALGVGGLAVALAFQDTLSNLFSGLQIIISQQLKPGDYVLLENGLEGVVEDITWRNTTIKSLTNNLIIVPNSKLSSSTITNYSQPLQTIAFTIAIGIGYTSELNYVEKEILEVATTILQTIPGGDTEFTPLVRYHTFGNSAIEANIILRAKAFTDQGLVKHEFIKALHQRFKQENIDIPYPIQTVLLKQDA